MLLPNLVAQHFHVSPCGSQAGAVPAAPRWQGEEGLYFCPPPKTLFSNDFIRISNNRLFPDSALAEYLLPWITQHVSAARNHCFPKVFQRNTFGIQHVHMVTLQDLRSGQREQGVGIIDFYTVSKIFRKPSVFYDFGPVHHGPEMLET